MRPYLQLNALKTRCLASTQKAQQQQQQLNNEVFSFRRQRFAHQSIAYTSQLASRPCHVIPRCLNPLTPANFPRLFLDCGPGHIVGLSHGFAVRRRRENVLSIMCKNRVYVCHSCYV